MSVTTSSSISKHKFIGTHSNHIKIGIIGTANVGKSLLLNLCARNDQPTVVDDYLFTTIDPYCAICTPYDERIEALSVITCPKSIVRSRVTVFDTAGASTLTTLAAADVLVHLLRGYQDENMVHYMGTIDPLRDLMTVNQELLLADLFAIEQSLLEIEALMVEHEVTVGENLQFQYQTLIKVWEYIAGESRPVMVFEKLNKKQIARVKARKPKIPKICKGFAVRFGSWDHSENELLSTYNLLTAKEMLYVVNETPRDYLRKYDSEIITRIKEYINNRNHSSYHQEVISISLLFEEKLYRIEQEGGLKEYFAANASHKSAIPIMLDHCYHILNLIHFYTMEGASVDGNNNNNNNNNSNNNSSIITNIDELKCWCLRAGKNISDAAAIVDINVSRNFLRGEVISCEDFIAYGGDKLKLMMDAKVKAETRKYVVNDGDILTFYQRK